MFVFVCVSVVDVVSLPTTISPSTILSRPFAGQSDLFTTLHPSRTSSKAGHHEGHRQSKASPCWGLCGLGQGLAASESSESRELPAHGLAAAERRGAARKTDLNGTPGLEAKASLMRV